MPAAGDERMVAREGVSSISKITRDCSLSKMKVCTWILGICHDHTKFKFKIVIEKEKRRKPLPLQTSINILQDARILSVSFVHLLKRS